MFPLPTNQRVLKLLCILPMDSDENPLKKIFYILFALFFLAADLSGLFASIAFFIGNVSTDLEESLYALFQISAFGGLTYMCVVAFLLRHKITAFLETLSKICNTHSNDNSFRFLARATNTSEKIWHYYFRLAMAGFTVSTIGIAVASVLFSLWIADSFDFKYLYRVYRLSLPWSQKSPIGYTATIALSIVCGESYLLLNGSILLLFISICWYHRAFFHRFEDFVQKLDKSNHEMEARRIICETIDFHSSIKEWFWETSDVFSLYILIQLICSVIFLACALFQIDLQLKHIDYGMIVQIMAVMVSLANLFFYCYFGKMASASYERMSKCLFESNWMELPVYLQKYFILMIGNMNRPIFYHGFGISVLNLETFTTMLRRAATFYMMFKTITS